MRLLRNVNRTQYKIIKETTKNYREDKEGDCSNCNDIWCIGRGGMFVIFVNTCGRYSYRMLKKIVIRTRLKGFEMKKKLLLRDAAFCIV